MIRVLVVDDHPILRAGVETVLRAEPGFTCVGTAAGSDELWPLLRRTRPHVVLLDRRLGDEDGLEVCRALRGEPAAPAVVVFTAERGTGLGPPAAAAGAAAVVEKSADPALLFDQLRLAARGVHPGGSLAASSEPFTGDVAGDRRRGGAQVARSWRST